MLQGCHHLVLPPGPGFGRARTPVADGDGVEQGVDVAVDRLDVAADPPRHLADRERAGAGRRAPDGATLRVGTRHERSTDANARAVVAARDATESVTVVMGILPGFRRVGS
jgi:hypothetical protein